MMEFTETLRREPRRPLTPLQLQYQLVCEHQQQALVRNQALLHDLERLRHHVSGGMVQMDRLKALKQQYEECVAATYPQWLEQVETHRSREKEKLEEEGGEEGEGEEGEGAREEGGEEGEGEAPGALAIRRTPMASQPLAAIGPPSTLQRQSFDTGGSSPPSPALHPAARPVARTVNSGPQPDPLISTWSFTGKPPPSHQLSPRHAPHSALPMSLSGMPAPARSRPRPHHPSPEVNSPPGTSGVHQGAPSTRSRPHPHHPSPEVNLSSGTSGVHQGAPPTTSRPRPHHPSLEVNLSSGTSEVHQGAPPTSVPSASRLITLPSLLVPDRLSVATHDAQKEEDIPHPMHSPAHLLPPYDDGCETRDDGSHHVPPEASTVSESLGDKTPVSGTEDLDLESASLTQPDGPVSPDPVEPVRPVSADPVKLLEDLSLPSLSDSEADLTSPQLQEVEAPPTATPTAAPNESPTLEQSNKPLTASSRDLKEHISDDSAAAPQEGGQGDRQSLPDGGEDNSSLGASPVAEPIAADVVRSRLSAGTLQLEAADPPSLDGGNTRGGEEGREDRESEEGKEGEEREREEEEGEDRGRRGEEGGKERSKRDIKVREGEEGAAVQREKFETEEGEGDGENTMNSDSEIPPPELPVEADEGKTSRDSAYSFLAQSMREDDQDSVHSSLISEGSAVAQLEKDMHVMASTPTPSAGRVEERGASAFSTRSDSSVHKTPLHLPSLSGGLSPDTDTDMSSQSDSLPFSPAYVPTAMEQRSQPTQPGAQADLRRRLGLLMDSDTDGSEDDPPLTTSINQDDKEDFDFYG